MKTPDLCRRDSQHFHYKSTYVLAARRTRFFRERAPLLSLKVAREVKGGCCSAAAYPIPSLKLRAGGLQSCVELSLSSGTKVRSCCGMRQSWKNLPPSLFFISPPRYSWGCSHPLLLQINLHVIGGLAVSYGGIMLFIQREECAFNWRVTRALEFFRFAWSLLSESSTVLISIFRCAFRWFTWPQLYDQSWLHL